MGEPWINPLIWHAHSLGRMKSIFCSGSHVALHHFILWAHSRIWSWRLSQPDFNIAGIRENKHQSISEKYSRFFILLCSSDVLLCIEWVWNFYNVSFHLKFWKESIWSAIYENMCWWKFLCSKLYCLLLLPKWSCLKFK